MTTKKRSKCHQRRRQIDVSPLSAFITIASRRTLSEERAMALSIPIHSAMVAMTKGDSSITDYETIAVALNFAAMLAEMGIGANGMPAFVKALELIYACSLRCEKSGVWRFTGEELGAINKAIELHDLQLTACSQTDLENAQKRILAHVQRGEVYTPA